MSLPADLGAFVEAVRKLNADGDLAAALNQVTDIVLAVIAHDDALGEVIGSAALDALCVELGKLDILPSDTPRDGAVIVATGLMPTGGHTRLIADLALAESTCPVAVLVTNVRHQLTKNDLVKLLPSSVEVVLAPDGNAAQTLRWAQLQLASLNPARTYALQHHYDAVAIAALQPQLTGKLIFLHHADYSLCLGIHLTHALHVDFHAKGFWHCRDRERLSDNRHWPLPVRVGESIVRYEKYDRRDEGPLRTCSSGGFEKFETPHLLNPIPYRIQYADMVATVLAATGGTHYHIGVLSEATRSAIHERLKSAGLLPETFNYISYTPNLGQALIDLDVDLYLGSMPKGGGRSTIEAMAVGVPLLLHSNYRSEFFSDQLDVYPAVLSWQDLSSLAAQLRKLTVATLRKHAEMAHNWYREHHTHDAFVKIVGQTDRRCAPPPRPSLQLDALQFFLDRKQR